MSGVRQRSRARTKQPAGGRDQHQGRHASALVLNVVLLTNRAPGETAGHNGARGMKISWDTLAAYT